MPDLPPGFRFGTATAAYQIEGATAADGRGPCVWDVAREHAAAEAGAGSYRRLGEDLELLQRLGVDAHRFSISWSRVFPRGRGPLNPAGLDYYDRLVDGLLDAGIEPTAVLYAADLPQALEDDGGWLNRVTVEAFAEYAAAVGARLADRVRHWIPVEGPNRVAFYGYGVGRWAPRRRLEFASFPAAHHLLLAHGRAAAVLRGAGAGSVGSANDHAPIWPATPDPADVGAAKLVDAVWNGLFLEAMLLGRYPADLAPVMDDIAAPGDLATIRTPLDFYGVDYVAPMRIASTPAGSPLPAMLVDAAGHPVTDAGDPIAPAGLCDWLVTAGQRYGAALPSMAVTCAGAAFHDRRGPDGRIDDRIRIAYLSGHLGAVAAAVAAGAEVSSFTAFSLLDGWHWDQGHDPTYGLVHVDPHTLARTPKSSFQWYADLIAAQSAPA